MDKRILIEYIEAINRADVNTLYKLMSEDFLFIDAHDNTVEGPDAMRQSWTAYFDMFPDYRIEINDMLENDSLICILGYASGTYRGLINETDSNYWRIPAAWTVMIDNDKVRRWQVYADNIIVRDIINRNDNNKT